MPEYKRFLFEKIDFSERLIGILGSRGVGKTTILLQYLHEVFKEKKTLYLISDHPLLIELGLFAIADEFQKKGGEILIIDEKYTFEIGGKDKSFKQLKDAQHGYVVVDDIEIGIDKKIPLWIFGFLY